jgi:hypothetical protein
MAERVRKNETGIQNREFKVGVFFVFLICSATHIWDQGVSSMYVQPLCMIRTKLLKFHALGEGVKDPVVWAVTLVSFTNAVSN